MINEKEFWYNKISYLRKMKAFFSSMEYKGINLWPIMANEVYTYYKNQDRKLFERIINIIRCLFFKENLYFSGKKGRILATYFMPRKDHRDLVKGALSKFNKDELFLLDFYYYKKSMRFSGYKFTLPNIFLLLRIWHKFNKNKGLKKLLRKYYYLFIAKTYLRQKQIDNFYDYYKIVQPKVYIAFCSSAFPEETILTLLCKKHNVPTFTLQHGFLDNRTSEFTPFIVQSENIVSDYSLLWGKSSFDVQKKFTSPDILLVVGNPKYSLSEIKRKNFNPKRCSVFLSVTAYPESNIKLVRIINDFAQNHPDISFQITTHPFDKVNNYKNLVSAKNIKLLKADSVKELLEKSDFVFVHNTSVAYEALLYSIPILRFKDKDYSPTWENFDTFENLDQLEKLFYKLKNKEFYENMMKIYKKQMNNFFYFDKNVDVPTKYYQEIMNVLDE